MKSLKSGILITSIGVLLAFMSVVYTSCYKVAELNPEICQDLICQNKGYCFSDTAKKTHYCKCPFGYTGDSCSILVNQKFIGSWTITETLISSNNHSYSWGGTPYTGTMTAGSVPYAFFINNFRGSTMFNEVNCVIDSLNDNLGNNFLFEPEFTPIQNSNFHITGGNGSTPVSSANETYPLSMSGVYYTNWTNPGYMSGNFPQKDTISFTMTRQ